MDIIEKYKPKSVDELVCNKRQTLTLLNWLKNYEEKTNSLFADDNKKSKKGSKLTPDDGSCMIITGCHGVGKTASVEIAIKDAGYIVQKIRSSMLTDDSNKDTFDVVSLLNDKEIKYVRVIDELESVSSPQDKGQILALIKKNNDIRKSPVIIVSNNQHNKLLTEIKKIACELKFYKPSETDMKIIMSKVAKGEGIRFKSIDVVQEILDRSQSDIRKMLYVLRDLKKISCDKHITKETVTNYFDNTKSKDLDFNLFDSARKLLYDYSGIQDCLTYFDSQTVLLPLMIHQYYTDVVTSNFDDEEEQFKIVNDIAESLSIGDVVENLIYGDQNWKAREVHGFFTCVYTSYRMCTGRSYEEPNMTSFDFPKDLNKTSIKKINKRNIDNTNKCIINKDIIDYIYICKIVKQLIKQNKIEECSRLLKPHGIKLEHIESLLKIEKIQYKNDPITGRSTKMVLTSKQKKELISYLED